MFVDPVSVYLLDFAVTMNDYSPGSVDPQLLNVHLHSGCLILLYSWWKRYNRLLLLTRM